MNTSDQSPSAAAPSGDANSPPAGDATSAEGEQTQTAAKAKTEAEEEAKLMAELEAEEAAKLAATKSSAPPANTTGRTGTEGSVHDRGTAGAPEAGQEVDPNAAAPSGDKPSVEDDEDKEGAPRTLLALLDKALKAPDLSHDDANRIVQIRQHLAELKGRLTNLELTTSRMTAAVLANVEQAI